MIVKDTMLFYKRLMTCVESRRHFLRTAAKTSVMGVMVAASPLILPRSLMAQNPLRDRKLSLYNIHTGEFLKENYMERGEIIPEVLEKIKLFLRDHRNNQTHDIDMRLIHLVNRLQQDCGLACQATFDVISGYRSPASNAKLRAQGGGVARNSKHLTGCAIDIKLPNRLKELRDLARSYQQGGVGYYPKSGFVHVDIRSKPTFWGAA